MCKSQPVIGTITLPHCLNMDYTILRHPKGLIGFIVVVLIIPSFYHYKDISQTTVERDKAECASALQLKHKLVSILQTISTIPDSQVNKTTYFTFRKYIASAVARSLLLESSGASNNDSTMFDARNGGLVTISKLLKNDSSPKLPMKTFHPFTYYDLWTPWTDILDFSQCEYSQCQLTFEKKAIHRADIILFSLKHLERLKKLPQSYNRRNQYWIINAKESAAFTMNIFQSSWNGRFDISATYRSDSTVQTSDFKREIRRLKHPLSSRDYSANKSADMVTYMSNCKHITYDRVSLMRNISEGFIADIYGKCTDNHPHCSATQSMENEFHNSFDSAQPNCSHYHAKYRFYCAFENSLCTEYITEKFWSVLSSKDYMVPIVMGGLSVQDYTRVAPPDSFIHVENFTSIAHLQQYIRHLIARPEAYNRYHKWRENYELVPADKMSACELCKIAHLRPGLQRIQNLTGWWNHRTNCRNSSMATVNLACFRSGRCS